MKYQKTADSNYLGMWRYHAQYAFHYDLVKTKHGSRVEKWRSQEEWDQIRSIEIFLTARAEMKWLRKGNNFYFIALGDIFNLRLFFEEGLRFIREAQGFQPPL